MMRNIAAGFVLTVLTTCYAGLFWSACPVTPGAAAFAAGAVAALEQLRAREDDPQAVRMIDDLTARMRARP